jgi:hypothetical protein
MESTNKLTDTSKLASDKPAFLSVLAFLVPVGHPAVANAAGICPSSPVLPSLSVSNSIPLLATREFLETMHHVEVFSLILGLVQV